MTVNWTKQWEGSDDGSIIGGADLRNLQDDLANVLTTSDIGYQGYLVVFEGDILTYEGNVVYI